MKSSLKKNKHGYSIVTEDAQAYLTKFGLTESTLEVHIMERFGLFKGDVVFYAWNEISFKRNVMPLHPNERFLPGSPESVPMMMLNEEWAQHNHSQDLEELAGRGGLGSEELLANIDRRRWQAIGTEEAIRQLNRRIEKYNSAQANAIINKG